jgi:hypothetical protein
MKKRLQSIAAMWKEALGVELTIQNREWQIWLAAHARSATTRSPGIGGDSDVPEAASFHVRLSLGRPAS